MIKKRSSNKHVWWGEGDNTALDKRFQVRRQKKAGKGLSLGGEVVSIAHQKKQKPGGSIVIIYSRKGEGLGGRERPGLQ